MTIAKKIALITGGKIHKEKRETPLSSLEGVNERVIVKSRVDSRLGTRGLLLVSDRCFTKGAVVVIDLT